jgi:hypothetical protein
MQYLNITPPEYVERDYCFQIYENLKHNFDDSTYLCVRNWETETSFNNVKRIVIVTSAEGHKYTPKDFEDPNCIGVFMHYYPKESIEYQYNPEHFTNVNGVFPLPLGTTKFFEPLEPPKIKDRIYDVSFIGQLNQYTRIKFYNAVNNFTNRTKHSTFVEFYSGWNNGFSGSVYSNILRNSKIALVPWGSASLDTFRFFEACQSGCIILSDPQNKYEFMSESPHKEILWDNLENEVDNLLQQSPEFLQDISSKTISFFENRLSPKACANFIMEKS